MSKQQRVLVVVDPTATSHPSIERAAWFARHTGASIELFISDYAPQLADPRSHGAAATEARAALLERHRRRLEQLAQPLRTAGLAVAIDARLDHPLYDSIVRKAQDSAADFVIKDTHYHSVLKRSIFSNTDWNLIRNCGTRQGLLVLTEQLRAEAVVMGALSRSGLKGLFIGNTAEDVLDRLYCDLVIVKPAGFRAVLQS